MSIKLRLMGGFFGIALLVGITGAIAVLEQFQTAEQAAIVEAKNIGETIGLAVMARDQENLQSFITQLHTSQQRDVEVVDLNKRIVADVIPEDVGTILTHDMGNEVGLTMQDGQVRTFVEISPEYPQGIKHLVVPIKNLEGKIIGAIIVEYTALYEELRSGSEATGRIIATSTFACLILALALGYSVSTSISGPILKLRDAAGQIEQGQLNVPFPRAGRDEIGQLVTSFAHMTDQLRQTLTGLEQRIAERTSALSQSEERFKLMAWATKDAVWDWDLQTDQIWWGEGLQKIFYYSPDTTQTNPEWRLDHIHPEDRAKVDLVINQTLEGGMEFWSKEYRFQRLDGTYANIMDRGYVIRNEAGKATRMIGAMMDITERKYMESMLVQSNEKMGQILNELQQSNRDTSLLNELSHQLQACQSTQEAFGIITDLSKHLFPRTAGALYLLNTARTQISAVASWGELSSASDTFTPDNCKALCIGLTRPLNTAQPATCCLHFAQAPGITYCLPIQMQGEILGIFHLQSTSEEYLTEIKRQLANTVVEQSQMALSNLKLREALVEQSIRDPLTELYNRRYMEEALNQQLSRVTRQLHPLGLIMIDIDHFKNFNDAYGHAAGDALLRELGRLLQSHVRGEDVACRYGGEEFLIIMPDASLEAAHQRAVLLQQEAKNLHVQDAGQSLEGITLSLGVAIYPEHGRSIDSVLRAADAALYRAKQEGRDRVVVADRAR